MEAVETKGSFRRLIRNLRIKQNEKYSIPDIENSILQGEEGKNTEHRQ